MNKFLSTHKTPPGFWKYVQPESGFEVSRMSFDSVMGAVEEHRRSYNLDLSPGWEERVEDEMTFYNDSPSQDPDNPKPFEDQLARFGRKLWKELHAFAHNFPTEPTPIDIQDARGWISSWEARIPFRGCSCKQNWDGIRRIWNPDFSSRICVINSFIDVHNIINMKLGKPHFPK